MERLRGARILELSCLLRIDEGRPLPNGSGTLLKQLQGVATAMKEGCQKPPGNGALGV